MFDFDTPLPLAGNPHAQKWSRYAGRDVIPMWVADMDFAAPPPVIDALHTAVAAGHFGYTSATPSQHEAVCAHLQRQYAWSIQPDWIVWLPGLVSALNVAVRAFTRDDEAVFSATPVYPPFLNAPRLAQRKVGTLALERGEHGWGWDFDALDRALPGHRLWLFCHPHNPVGRAWREDELAQIGALAERHDLIVCSDEIHCDLILDPARKHTPLAAACPALAQRSITLMAPSKTYNIPGLGASFAIIPDAQLRHRFTATMAGIVPHANLLGLVALEAAFRHGEPWRLALLDVLRRNAARVESQIAKLPGLRTTPVEATYLAWIDCRDWMRERSIADPCAHFEQAGLALSNGKDFGAPGFVRLNFGCPASTLEAGLARLAAAAQ
ncbi:MAG: PatB family C-S lyase [Betaproteobacteria bacterium]|nr:PatB family C-S lyase [Betaproteobacteria bacterium]